MEITHIMRSTVTGRFLLPKVAHFIFGQLWLLESFFSHATIFYFQSFCLWILVLPYGSFHTFEASHCWIGWITIHHCGL